MDVSIPAAVSAVSPEVPPDAGQAVRILADPPELRVWANTRVRLSVETAQTFARYVWHFEDGSDPVAGAVVEHVFAESVRDRHVTVEAEQPGQPTVVATRRLPVERLPVLGMDGEEPSDVKRLPKPNGTRLLLAGGPIDQTLAVKVAEVAETIEAQAIVVTGDLASAQRLAQLLAAGQTQVAVLHAPVEESPEKPLNLLHNPGDVVTEVRRGSRDLGVLALGNVALVGVDTRPRTLEEQELRRLHDALQWTTAFHATLVLSARPWTLTKEGEMIADRAYRLYEYALRAQVAAVISASSLLYFDGRFGGIHVLGVGQALATPGCNRPLGEDTCQEASLTVLDVPPTGPLTVHVLTGTDFATALSRHALPAEIGKIRR